jgi:hypothetical protein
LEFEYFFESRLLLLTNLEVYCLLFQLAESADWLIFGLLEHCVRSYPPEALNHDVVTILRIGLNSEVVVALTTCHGKLIDLGAEVLAHLPLTSIEAHSSTNRLTAAEALDIEHHLKAHNRCFFSCPVFDDSP